MLVAATNPGWALAADAVSFALGAVFIGAMHMPAGLRIEGSNMLAELRDGAGAARRRRARPAATVSRGRCGRLSSG